MRGARRNPGRKLARDLVTPGPPLHFQRSLDRVQQLVHVMPVPWPIDIPPAATKRSGTQTGARRKHLYQWNLHAFVIVAVQASTLAATRWQPVARGCYLF